MTDTSEPKIGSIAWADLTVTDAVGVHDFYAQVVGWQASEVGMGGYSDFAMSTPGSGEMVAGVCHARGLNADLPAHWLIYILVKDLDDSIARCRELGGKLLSGPRRFGAEGTYCVIEDPAGAVAALFERAG
jgi:predicted enzyme related to lactoylglutathione lyase